MKHRYSFLLFFPIAVSAILFTGCSPSSEPLIADALLLGTYVRISVYDGKINPALLDAALSRVREIEKKMSVSTEDYDDTELLRVNRAAGQAPVAVSPDTFSVVKEALRFSELTGGAFDVAIGPLVSLWGIGSGGESVPEQSRIDALLSLLDFSAVEMNQDTSTIYLPQEGMGLDVGGIAKGYAADEAARILRDAGVTSALLDFGGNIFVIGEKLDGSAWRIGIQRPDAERSDYIGVLSVRDATVVTSGPYERFFVSDGVRYHHILDAKTGYPAESGLEQVTIVTRRSIEADALSTACFVLGLGPAEDLIESLPGIEAIFVDTEATVYVTSGIGDSFDLTDPVFGFE